MTKAKVRSSSFNLPRKYLLVAGLAIATTLMFVALGAIVKAQQLQLELENATLRAKYQEAIQNNSTSTPTTQPTNTPAQQPTQPAKQTSGCDQNQIDKQAEAFGKYAITSGHDPAEVDAFVELLKTTGCSTSNNSPNTSQPAPVVIQQPATNELMNEIEETNSKLDRLQMCQSYGICY